MEENSIWLSGEARAYPALRGRRTADAAVIGGGFTGLTTALWLGRAGLRVILLEANTLGSGASSRCAGIASLSNSLFFARLEREHGKEAASAYARTQQSALQALRELAREPEARTGWRDEDVFLVSRGGEEAALRAEAEAMTRAGIPAQAAPATQSPLPAEHAIRLPGMGTLHPLGYLQQLARLGEKQSVKIYERSRVVALETNLVSTQRGSVLAPYIVVATGYPVVNTPGWYFLRLVQRQSCLIPLGAAPAFDGAYLDAKGAYGLRKRGNGLLLCLNGGRVGEAAHSLMQRFKAGYAPYLGPCGAEQPVVGGECFSADGLPYIGPYGKKTPNLFVATGFGGRGLLNGMVAAQAISARVLGLPGDEYRLYSGQRPSAKGAEIKMALGTGRRYLQSAARLAAPRCPHMGCRLRYRADLRLWECPCHGSRFDDIGRVLNAPAVYDAEIKRRK